MSGAARKGLKRHGLRSYIITGPKFSFIIRRARPGKFLVRKEEYEAMPWADFAIMFHTLRDARAWAEKNLWPFPAKYKKRVRRSRNKSDPQAIMLAGKLIAEERIKHGQ